MRPRALRAALLALLTAGEVAIGRGLRHRGGTHSS